MENDKTVFAKKLITSIRDDKYIDGRTFSRIKSHIFELLRETQKDVEGDGKNEIKR